MCVTKHIAVLAHTDQLNPYLVVGNCPDVGFVDDCVNVAIKESSDRPQLSGSDDRRTFRPALSVLNLAKPIARRSNNDSSIEFGVQSRRLSHVLKGELNTERLAGRRCGTRRVFIEYHVGSGVLPGDRYCVQHRAALSSCRSPLLLQEKQLESKQPQLQHSNNGEYASEEFDPTGTRFLIAIVAAIAAPFGIYSGVGLIDRDRRLFGCGLATFSVTGFAAAIFLLFLSSFRWSWGWLL